MHSSRWGSIKAVFKPAVHAVEEEEEEEYEMEETAPKRTPASKKKVLGEAITRPVRPTKAVLRR